MEQLNMVNLRGAVGSVRISQFEDRKVAHMTVATNFAYKAKDGTCVIETTWHQVVAWEGDRIQSLEDISRGDMVAVEGRLRNQRFTGPDGTERSCTEILCSRLEKIASDEPLRCEM